MTVVALFDIDGTILKTAGAGRAALDAAIAVVTGVSGSVTGISIAGRTDRAIIFDALAVAGIAPAHRDFLFERVAEQYVSLLPAHVAAAPGNVLPGVRELLAAVETTSVISTVATGNLRGGAEIKLRHFGLWREEFARGGFGEVSSDRSEVVRAAMDSYVNGAVPTFVVIGDTPHDIEAARKTGAASVAVATGAFTSDALRAAGAGTVFETLEDTAGVIRAILSA